jgi:hypothetical protein
LGKLKTPTKTKRYLGLWLKGELGQVERFIPRFQGTSPTPGKAKKIKRPEE